jgi:hypothetical protein
VAVLPVVADDTPTAGRLLVGKEEQAPTAPERPARGKQMPPPLLARRHGEDPEVRDAEVGSVKALPPGLPVTEELAPEGGLVEAPAHNRHGAAVSFKEEVRQPPMIRLPLEAQAENPIRLYPEAMELAALVDFDLPAERQTQAPGCFRRSGEDLLRRDELHPFRVAADHLDGHHDLGHREGMAKELAGDVAVPVPSQGAASFALGGEDRRAPVPEGVDHGLGALGVPVELRGRPVEIAVDPSLLDLGLEAATLEYFGAGYCTKGLLKGRLAIPIHNGAGKLVAYAGLALDPATTPRYLFPPNFHPGLEVFNLDCLAEAEGPLYLTPEIEGVLRLTESDVVSVVGLFDGSLSEAQEEAILGEFGSYRSHARGRGLR